LIQLFLLNPQRYKQLDNFASPEKVSHGRNFYLGIFSWPLYGFEGDRPFSPFGRDDQAAPRRENRNYLLKMIWG